MEAYLPSIDTKVEDSIIQAPFYRELVFFYEANCLFYFFRLLMIEVGLILRILVGTFIITAPICILRSLRIFMSCSICIKCLFEDIDASYIIFIHLIIYYLNPQTSYWVCGSVQSAHPPMMSSQSLQEKGHRAKHPLGSWSEESTPDSASITTYLASKSVNNFSSNTLSSNPCRLGTECFYSMIA